MKNNVFVAAMVSGCELLFTTQLTFRDEAYFFRVGINRDPAKTG